MEALVLAIYFISIFVLSIFGSHGFVLVYYYFKNKKDEIEGRKKKLKPKTVEELFGSEENYPNLIAPGDEYSCKYLDVQRSF